MWRIQDSEISEAGRSRADSAQDIIRDKEGQMEQEEYQHNSGDQSQDGAGGSNWMGVV